MSGLADDVRTEVPDGTVSVALGTKLGVDAYERVGHITK